MADSIKRAKDAFGADNCIVLSNSAGSGDDAPEYTAAKACEAALGLRVARHPEAQKPQCLEGVVASLSVKDASTVAVVGDRLATDVLAANEIGALSVHTLRSIRAATTPPPWYRASSRTGCSCLC